MEKKEITREQAIQIEVLLEAFSGNKGPLLDSHALNDLPWRGSREVLNSLTLDDMARALYVGYEVEVGFKEGDWIYIDYKGSRNGKGLISKVISVSKQYSIPQLEMDDGWSISTVSPHIRHATDEEIATEKQRRWWAKHDRDVWGVKSDDVLIIDGRVEDVDYITESGMTWFKSGYAADLSKIRYRVKVVCFAEDRKDIN